MPAAEQENFTQKYVQTEQTIFRDALHLRYGWDIRNVPQSCVCGSSFSVDHALSCKRGGFPILRHNEIRDLTAKMLSEVCHSVATELPLQPLSGESFSYRSAIVGAEARLDIKARGFWNLAQDAYFDVRVFHPNAPCYRSRDLASVCKQHESAKKREYNQRIQNVEHGLFTPLVFTTTGSMGREGTTFYKRLADIYVITQAREALLGGDGMAALSIELRHTPLLNHVLTGHSVLLWAPRKRGKPDLGLC